MTDFLDTPQGTRIAYNRSAGSGPGVVFLGGFRSDMQGTKALALEAWARARGRAFLRFDYSGHGESGGEFLDGCIGDWCADARAAIEALTKGPQVLVGSSMGGWIALLLARAIPSNVAGLVAIAAAPDFTRRFRQGLSTAEQAELAATGRVAQPSEYSEGPYIFTRRLLDEAEAHLVLEQPLPLPMPVRFLQGTADADVPVDVAYRLLAHATGPDMRLTLVKDADHRFSSPECLALIEASVADVLNVAEVRNA
jgi:pimeloyl-ACP methyl ester carboxylesterase